LQQYNALLDVLISGSGEAALYREVLTDEAARNAGQECEVKIGTEFKAISLSRPAYEKLRALPKPTDKATAHYLARTLQAFELSGVALDAGKRAEARKLADRISELTRPSRPTFPKASARSPSLRRNSRGCRPTTSSRTSRKRTGALRCAPTPPTICRS
jgi:Zn-dependent oligopeptidase